MNVFEIKVTQRNIFLEFVLFTVHDNATDMYKSLRSSMSLTNKIILWPNLYNFTWWDTSSRHQNNMKVPFIAKRDRVKTVLCIEDGLNDTLPWQH